tara:strand:+ start:4311 stop:5252 length:942 start_codon:yes stop_codon:yes gene_type:complete
MIRTIFNIDDIPSNWIFENYCNLNEKLYGQSVKILSMFNHKDTVPSMVIYVPNDDNKYLFKDFSSGTSGSGIKLVMSLFNLTRKEAIIKIFDDYRSKENINISEIRTVEKYKVTSHEKRKWNVKDAKYWLKYNIDSDILEKYNVFPLKSFTLSKNIDGKINEFKKEKGYIYGYFKNDGSIYKIYQPNSKNPFFKVSSYIQGTEQLEYKSKTLIICSSLKDMMSLESLNFNVESIAPSSENTMIPKNQISSLILKYDNIYTLFDNDEAGYRASDKYKNMYGIPSIHINLSKDISDSIKDFTASKVKNYINPLIP